MNLAVGIVFGSRFDRTRLAGVQIAVAGRFMHVNSLTVNSSEFSYFPLRNMSSAAAAIVGCYLQSSSIAAATTENWLTSMLKAILNEEPNVTGANDYQ